MNIGFVQTGLSTTSMRIDNLSLKAKYIDGFAPVTTPVPTPVPIAGARTI